MLSMHELSLSMPEPMLSLSMLILAKSGQSKSKSWLTKVPVGSQKPSNLVRNGSRIDGLARNKDQMNPKACPDPSGPLLTPKTVKNLTFQGKRPPAAARGPWQPPHSYWVECWWWWLTCCSADFIMC